MRLTLSSSALSSRLGILSKVINSKNSLPILDCFLFEVANNQLTITASDNENVMKTTIPVDYADCDARFAVNNRTIMDAMKELPEQPLTLDVDTDTYSIKVIYQNGLYNFTTQNADEYPVAQPLQSDATTLTLQSSVLADNISRSIFATTSDELRPVMNGIYFDLAADALAIVASDGHKLVRNRNYSIKSDNPTSFILPKKPANLLKNVLAKDGSDVVIRFDSRTAEVTFGDSILQCCLIEGRYPNYNSVIPQNNSSLMVIDRKILQSALRRIMPFASESSQLVRLHIEMGKLEVSSEDIDFSTSAKEEISCDYSGVTMNIGFKGSSLLEVLNNLTSDNVRLEFADPSRPCLIIPEQMPDNEDVLMLIMPMLLND